MLDIYLWTTPNGRKPLILLEELDADYQCKWIPLDGSQHEADFLAINPNGKIPALVDHDEKPVATIIESGAILIYLAEKYGRFLPDSGAARGEVLGWLMWQMGGIGPMFGQYYHFKHAAPDPIPYALTRYKDEVRRLYQVMDKRLAEQRFLGGDAYTIADMATFPWVYMPDQFELSLDDFPHVRRWVMAIMERPAVNRAMAKKPAE